MTEFFKNGQGCVCASVKFHWFTVSYVATRRKDHEGTVQGLVILWFGQKSLECQSKRLMQFFSKQSQAKHLLHSLDRFLYFSQNAK